MTAENRKTTDAELAILSLLAERPMHGYQIEQIIEERGMREWTELGFSSIYYLLGKLKNEGLLESRLVEAEGKGPTRQVFRLTSTGKVAWRLSAVDAIANPSRVFSNFQLGLSNIRALDRSEVLIALDHHKTSLASRKIHIQKKLDSYGAGVPFEARILFDLSFRQISCELDWVEDLFGQLSAR